MGTVFRPGVAQQRVRRRGVTRKCPKRVTLKRVLSVFERAPQRNFSIRELFQILNKRFRFTSDSRVTFHESDVWMHTFDLQRQLKIAQKREYYDGPPVYCLLNPEHLAKAERTFMEWFSEGHKTDGILNALAIAGSTVGRHARGTVGFLLERMAKEGKVTQFGEPWQWIYGFTGKQALEWELRQNTPVV